MADAEKPVWMVGIHALFKTSLGDEFEGEIFSYDNTTNCVTIQEILPSQKRNFRVIRATFIKEVEVLSIPTSERDARLPPININRIRSREDTALRAAHLEASRIGVGVSAEAQGIFNALVKTLPCRWSGTSILVFEDVKIASPYGASNVTGSDQLAVNRVKKVLEGERKKLGKAL